MINIYFATGFKMSYVAEWRGGGPHDLLRGFDSFRNCFVIVFLLATMVRPKPGCVFTLPFFYAKKAPCRGLWLFYVNGRFAIDFLPQFLKSIDQTIGGRIMGGHRIIVLQLPEDFSSQLLA